MKNPTPQKILPFQALLYNPGKIDSLADVVTPPYDVISPEMQQELYARSPYNFCRVDLTRETGDARYETAAQTFAEWQASGVIVKDGRPAIYVHHQGFTLPDGHKVTRKGFLAACRLQDYTEGGIKPHEKTLEAPKIDRFRLMAATHAQLSPVFVLYGDAKGEIDGQLTRLTQATPAADFVTHDGERHQLWRLSDSQACAHLASTLSNRPLFIADGHHRYETALNYRNHVLRAHPDLPPEAAVRHILMYFCSLSDPGLVILPIHRALHNLSGFSLPGFLKGLASRFEVEELQTGDEAAMIARLEALGKDRHAFCLLPRDPGRSYVLSLARDAWRASPEAQGLPPALAGLDVTVLHRLVFEHILGISEASQARQDNIIYWKSTAKAIDETRAGGCELTFLLNPTRIADMEAVALAGHKMPQKSTYFFPKILSGLVLHDVSPGVKDG